MTKIYLNKLFVLVDENQTMDAVMADEEKKGQVYEQLSLLAEVFEDGYDFDFNGLKYVNESILYFSFASHNRPQKWIKQIAQYLHNRYFFMWFKDEASGNLETFFFKGSSLLNIFDDPSACEYGIIRTWCKSLNENHNSEYIGLADELEQIRDLLSSDGSEFMDAIYPNISVFNI